MLKSADISIPSMASDKNSTIDAAGPFGRSQCDLPQSADNSQLEARAIMRGLGLRGSPTRAGSVHYGHYALFMDALQLTLGQERKGAAGPHVRSQNAQGSGS